MRFERIARAEYLKEEQVLRFSGMANGAKCEVELPVYRPSDFLMLIGAVFQEAEAELSATHTSNLIPIHRLNMGVGREPRENRAVVAVFEITVGELTIKFGAPIDHIDPSRNDALERILAEASALMNAVIPSVRRH